LKNKILIKRNCIYSNDEQLLKKIKIRLEGLLSNGYENGYVPIIINIKGTYYFIENNFERLTNINCFDDNEIINSYMQDKMERIYDIKIPAEMANLPKEREFDGRLNKERQSSLVSEAPDGRLMRQETIGR
jgi:hypothetical protein